MVQKQSDQGMRCLSRPFWQATNVHNFEHLLCVYFLNKKLGARVTPGPLFH